tara:strand:+ start:65 stop:820 length:756 start_codon:yes stop_codon:yes gene_type:complete
MGKKLSQDELWAKSNRWAIPYADLVTLLLTFFVLLLVILNEDEKLIEKEVSKLLSETAKQLQKNVRNDNVDILRTDKGVQITLRGDLFPSASDKINKKFQPLLKQIGGVAVNAPLFNLYNESEKKKRAALLKRLKQVNDSLFVEVRIEGHTDDLPLPTKKRFKFKDNWQLSSARALSVVKLLQNMTGLPPDKFSALGYGEYKPSVDVTSLKTNSDKNRARNMNRRVEIILTANRQNKSKIARNTLAIDLED